MSTKRRAETNLNADNWDQEEPEEKEEDGGFKMAPKEVLEKRVIRTAKRRSQATGDGVQKLVFSGFSGFNKTLKSSFDFLANLTNGSKPNSGSTSTTYTATVSSSSMMSKPSINSPSSGIFSLSATSTPKANASPFGQTTSEPTIFGGSGTTPAFTPSVFSSSKPDSTVNDNPFKGQSSVSSAPFAFKSGPNPEKPVSQVSSTLFGVPSGNTNLNNTPLPAKTTNNPVTTFKAPVTSTPQSADTKKIVNKEEVKDEKELLYYAHLKALNESVLAWIKKNVEATPLCILTPIFRDYEKHLKGIQENFEKSKEQSSNKNVPETKDNNILTNTTTTNKENKGLVTLTGSTQGSTLFSKTSSTSNSLSLTPNTTSSTVDKISNFSFGINTSTTTSANTFTPSSLTPNTTSSTVDKTSSFSFGINTSTTTSADTFTPSSLTPNTTSSTVDKTSNFSFGITSTTTSANTFTPSPGFSFGIKPSSTSSSPFAVTTSPAVTTTSPFAVTTTSPFAVTTTSSFSVTTTPFATPSTISLNNSTTPFSFGIGKPFASNSNIKKEEAPTSEPTNADENEDEPPKVEYTPIAEKNSVYDKKCKVFVKKDGNFVDKGIGTLYIKKIVETGKHQLLVRANTSLGNVLINLILSSSLPIQRMGKNNVIMVCVPTPESEPPPTSILIRVKTSEDADELLKTLNEYKA